MSATQAAQATDTSSATIEDEYSSAALGAALAVSSTQTVMPMRTVVPSIKLDNMKPLRGLDNYEAWSCQVWLVLFAIGAKSIISPGIIPEGMTTEVANNLMQQAWLVIIQLVSEPIMTQLANLT